MDFSPGMHTLHSVAPSMSEYSFEFSSHGLQTGDPCLFAALPFSHGMQSTPPRKLVWPGLHATQVRFSKPLVPAGQGSEARQTPLSSHVEALRCQPRAILIAVAPSSLAILPSSGSAQVLPPVSFWNQPFGHWKHFGRPDSR